MPLLTVTTSAPALAPAAEANFFLHFTRLLARELGKPASYVMVALHPAAALSFAGDARTPAVYAELKNIGTFTPARANELSSLLCTELERALTVKADRIYIEFSNANGALWGWNHETFGE